MPNSKPTKKLLGCVLLLSGCQSPSLSVPPAYQPVQVPPLPPALSVWKEPNFTQRLQQIWQPLPATPMSTPANATSASPATTPSESK